MSIYYITILYCLLYGIAYQQSSDCVKKILNILFVLSFMVVFGFRYQVGVDWFNYIEVYNRHVNSTVLFDTLSWAIKPLICWLIMLTKVL